MELENLSHQIGVRITIDLGHRTGRIRLQGQSKDVYMADSKVKETLHKIRADLMEQQEAVMLAQFVRITFGQFHVTIVHIRALN